MYVRNSTVFNFWPFPLFRPGYMPGRKSGNGKKQIFKHHGFVKNVGFDLKLEILRISIKIMQGDKFQINLLLKTKFICTKNGQI